MEQESPMDLTSTQQFDATIRLAPPQFLMKLQTGEGVELLRILPNGDVEAESLENASEAGRLFIEAMRIHGKPLLERIQDLEAENEKLKIELYEMRQGDQIF